ncbi:MAG: DUF3822 family protein [Bergeyella sp.]|nr:DUF3822 family protein [Bergeyella sp.]
MKKLLLLFTKDGLQYQLAERGNVIEGRSFFIENETDAYLIHHKLREILAKKSIGSIQAVSAINHFSMMPKGFERHEMAHSLISYNAPVKKDKEELTLSYNKKYKIQFYYALPKEYYREMQSRNIPHTLGFSGNKLLNSIQTKNQKEMHINLYFQQCEFVALDEKKVVLYNNLDIRSDVDFLYFVLFTLDKIEFSSKDTHFFIYGEVVENETFISELRKFVNNVKICYENSHKKHFILNY